MTSATRRRATRRSKAPGAFAGTTGTPATDFRIVCATKPEVTLLGKFGFLGLAVPSVKAAATIKADDLAGVKKLYVWCDNGNYPGSELGVAVAERLLALGHPVEVWECGVQGMGGIKDTYRQTNPKAYRWQTEPHFREFIKIVLDGAARVTTPGGSCATPKPGAAPPGKAPVKEDGQDGPGLVTTCLNTIKVQPIHWAVPGYFPRGKLVMLAADGGLGKSTFITENAARRSRGECCLGMHYDQVPPPADVLLIGREDSYEDTVVPRLLAAGADLSLIHRLDMTRTRDGKEVTFSITHFEAMQAHLEAYPTIREVYIDPFGAYIGAAGVNENKDADVRSIMDPLAELAAKTDVTFYLVKHLTKGATARAVHKVAGSAAYSNACRAVFMLSTDPEDEDLRLLMPVKMNGAPFPQTRAFRFKELEPAARTSILSKHAKHLSQEDRDELGKQLHRIVWEGAVNKDADEVFAAKSKEPKKGKKAGDWLKEFLDTYAWPSEEVLDAGMSAGFTRNNLFDGKTMIGARAMKSTTKNGGWLWMLGDPAKTPLRPTPYSSDPSNGSGPSDSSHSSLKKKKDEGEESEGYEGSEEFEP
jgi:hypothetical protein